MTEITNQEKEAQAATELLKGAKVLVPFAVCLMSLAGVWYDARNQSAIMQKDITSGIEARAKSEARIQALTERMAAQEITLTEVKSDLKHIKDDTQETLGLVREWMRGR